VGHAFILLYLLVILLAMAAIAVAVSAFVRTRERVLGAFILHITAFTAFLLSYGLALSYTNLNVDEPPFGVLLAIIAVAMVSTAALAFAIPALTHALVQDDPRRIRTVIAAVAAAAILVSSRLSLRIDTATETIAQDRGFWMYLSLILFLLVIVYATVVKLVSLRRLAGEARLVVRNLLLLNLVLVTAFPLDVLLLARHRVMLATPLIYGCFCVVAAIYIGRRFLSTPAGGQAAVDLADVGAILDEAGISAREREVVALIVQGYGNQRIADELFISPNTVKTHNRNIFKRLGVKSRFELVMKLRHLAR